MQDYMNNIHKCHIIVSLLERMNHRLSMTNNLIETLSHTNSKSVVLQIEAQILIFACITRDVKK